MWFKSLDTKQFTLYTQQNARLNTAYWLGALIEHKSEGPIDAIIKAEMDGFDRQIKLLLKHVRKDIRRQKGLPLEIIKPFLKHTAFMHRHFIKMSKRSVISKSLAPLGFGVDMAVRKEVDYLELKYELSVNHNLFAGDLEQQSDRAILLIYQAIEIWTKSRSLFFSRRAIQRRLDTAKELLTPTADKIQQCTNAYITHLSLGIDESMTLEAHLIEDFNEQLSAGLSLIKFVSTVIFNQPGFIAQIFDKKRVNSLSEWIEGNERPMQGRLIASMIAPSDTIRRVIDAHVID